MSLLALKEAHALESGEEEKAQICADASKKFIEDHLISWVPEFAEGVLRETESEFYRLAALLLKDSIPAGGGR